MDELPTEVVLTDQHCGFEMSHQLEEMLIDEISEYLSDMNGYLVEGFSYRIEVSDIVWDIKE